MEVIRKKRPLKSARAEAGKLCLERVLSSSPSLPAPLAAHGPAHSAATAAAAAAAAAESWG
eukprot:6481-Pleurochrysis_carterae.AAC.2